MGEQGNIGKVSKGKREHEPTFRNRGPKLYKLVNENMVSKFVKRGTNKENVWKNENIGQFWKGKREQGPPLGDPHEYILKPDNTVTVWNLTCPEWNEFALSSLYFLSSVD